MRRALAALLAASLLSACASDPAADPDEPDAAGTPPPSAQAERSPQPAATAAPEIEGLVVTPRDELSRDHREGALSYEQLPPVGGPHNPRWLACDVYDEPVPNEFAVHSLEHGAVWLTYDPDLARDEVVRLGELADRNEEYVLVSPYDGLDSRIVAVAWGYSLEASSADDPRLAQFVDAFAGGAQGGEPGVPCRTGGVTPREARGQLDT